MGAASGVPLLVQQGTAVVEGAGLGSWVAGGFDNVGGNGGFGGGGGAGRGDAGFGGGAGIGHGGGGAGMGGAVFNLYGTVTITNSTLADNSAIGGASAQSQAGVGGGG